MKFSTMLKATAWLIALLFVIAGCRSSVTPGPSPTAPASPTPSLTPGPTTRPPSPTPTTSPPTTNVIPPEQARLNALALAQVQRWVLAHTVAAVAREAQGGYAVNLDGSWQPTTREIFDRARGAPYQTVTTAQPGAWSVLLSSQYGFPPAQVSVIVDNVTGAVLKVTPDLDAELKGGVLAIFDFNPSGQVFHAFVTNPTTINKLFELQSGKSRASIPFGALRPGPGPGMSNAPWSWSMDPNDIILAELSIELYDGLPQHIEDDLDYWLNKVKRFGPWSAKLVDIKDYR